MYAIVDIETTGGSAAYHKITEVAIIIHDGQQIVKEWQSLINPECGVPSGIAALTGISNEMVANAPKFYEVAKEVYQLLENNIFVAHNVNFDYSFLKKEFQELGAVLNLKKLCTVRLSRKVFPGLKSYSLGRLCDSLGIHIENRHRAMGDAKATATLMGLLVKKDDKGYISSFLKRNTHEADLPPHLPKSVFDQLPETTGVYYFHGEHREVLYVGKAKDIKKRVRSHFSSSDVIYKQRMKDQVYDITYELCGDEMIAYLFESYEIKRLFPMYNKAQKFTSAKYGLYHYEDGNGNQRLSIGKVSKGHAPLVSFTSFDRARDYLIAQVKKFKLDPSLCSLPASQSMYFGYSFKVGDSQLTSHNERLIAAIDSMKNANSTYCLVGEGRTFGECSVVLVLEGKYQGFGYFMKEDAFENLEQVQQVIKPFPDNPDVQRIIHQFIGERTIFMLDQ